MNTCEICGESKPKIQFIKINHFYKWNRAWVIWCRDCQKMFIEMKRFEEAKKELSEKTSGLVEFL